MRARQFANGTLAFVIARMCAGDFANGTLATVIARMCAGDFANSANTALVAMRAWCFTRCTCAPLVAFVSTYAAARGAYSVHIDMRGAWSLIVGLCFAAFCTASSYVFVRTFTAGHEKCSRKNYKNEKKNNFSIFHSLSPR